jgi:hypothetical protein
MERSGLRRLGAAVVLVAVIALNGAEGSCPSDAVAQESVATQTPLGSFEVDVCVARGADPQEVVCTFTVKNVDLKCPMQSFAIRPIAGMDARLELSTPWRGAKEEPNWWIWDGPADAPLLPGKSRVFVLHLSGGSGDAWISGAAFTNRLSPCGQNILPFQLPRPIALGAAQQSATSSPATAAASLTVAPTTTATNPDAWHTSVVARNWIVTPHELAFDSSGHVLVAANLDDRIAVCSQGGELLYYYSLPDTGVALGGHYEETCVATTTSGNSYALNSTGLYKLNADRSVTKIAPVAFPPLSMCAGQGETLYFTAALDNLGGLFEITLSPTPAIRQIASYKDWALCSLDRGPDGNLYASVLYAGEILRFSPDGSVAVFKSGFSTDGGQLYLAFSPDETLFLADNNAGSLYEISLDGDVIARPEFPYGEMLFLPDKSYFTLDLVSSQLIHYDNHGTRAILKSGEIGVDLVYMPSGALMTQVGGVGQYECFPSGVVRKSEVSRAGGGAWARYVFDRAGNAYYFEDATLYRIDPLGRLGAIAQGPSCPTQTRIERFQFSEAHQAVYSVCADGMRSAVVRYPVEGKAFTVYSNPNRVEHGTLDVDAAGNVYCVYHRTDNWMFEVLRLTGGEGIPERAFSSQGKLQDEAEGVIACAKEGLDSYFIAASNVFALQHLSAEGNVTGVPVAPPVVGVDFLGIEVSPEGDVYVVVPSILYRFSRNESAGPVSVPTDAKQVSVSIGRVADVAIPAKGVTRDTAVEIRAPGCWVYQRVASPDSLSFKIAVRRDAIPGEYDVVLHHPGQAPLVLKHLLRIQGSSAGTGGTEPSAPEKHPR